MVLRISFDGNITELVKAVIANRLGTVDCAEPRAEHDWFAACDILQRNPGILKTCERLVIAHVIQKCGGFNAEMTVNYDTVEYACGEFIWYQIQPERLHLPRPPYGAINFH
jgi:hypothetical protein